jgi:hypothetical protein
LPRFADDRLLLWRLFDRHKPFPWDVLAARVTKRLQRLCVYTPDRGG